MDRSIQKRQRAQSKTRLEELGTSGTSGLDKMKRTKMDSHALSPYYSPADEVVQPLNVNEPRPQISENRKAAGNLISGGAVRPQAHDQSLERKESLSSEGQVEGLDSVSSLDISDSIQVSSRKLLKTLLQSLKSQSDELFKEVEWLIKKSLETSTTKKNLIADVTKWIDIDCKYFSSNLYEEQWNETVLYSELISVYLDVAHYLKSPLVDKVIQDLKSELNRCEENPYLRINLSTVQCRLGRFISYIVCFYRRTPSATSQNTRNTVPLPIQNTERLCIHRPLLNEDHVADDEDRSSKNSTISMCSDDKCYIYAEQVLKVFLQSVESNSVDLLADVEWDINEKIQKTPNQTKVPSEDMKSAIEFGYRFLMKHAKVDENMNKDNSILYSKLLSIFLFVAYCLESNLVEDVIYNLKLESAKREETPSLRVDVEKAQYALRNLLEMCSPISS